MKTLKKIKSINPPPPPFFLKKKDPTLYHTFNRFIIYRIPPSEKGKQNSRSPLKKGEGSEL